MTHEERLARAYTTVIIQLGETIERQAKELEEPRTTASILEQKLKIERDYNTGSAQSNGIPVWNPEGEVIGHTSGLKVNAKGEVITDIYIRQVGKVGANFPWKPGMVFNGKLPNPAEMKTLAEQIGLDPFARSQIDPGYFQPKPGDVIDADFRMVPEPVADPGYSSPGAEAEAKFRGLDHEGFEPIRKLMDGDPAPRPADPQPWFDLSCPKCGTIEFCDPVARTCSICDPKPADPAESITAPDHFILIYCPRCKYSDWADPETRICHNCEHVIPEPETPPLATATEDPEAIPALVRAIQHLMFAFADDRHKYPEAFASAETAIAKYGKPPAEDPKSDMPF